MLQLSLLAIKTLAFEKTSKQLTKKRFLKYYENIRMVNIVMYK